MSLWEQFYRPVPVEIFVAVLRTQAVHKALRHTMAGPMLTIVSTQSMLSKLSLLRTSHQSVCEEKIVQ